MGNYLKSKITYWKKKNKTSNQKHLKETTITLVCRVSTETGQGGAWKYVHHVTEVIITLEYVSTITEWIN